MATTMNMTTNVPFDNELRYRIEDSALTFFGLAEKLEAILDKNTSEKDLQAVLEANMYLWRYSTHYIKSQFWMDIPKETFSLMDELADYMLRAGFALLQTYDEGVVKKMIHMNIRMCNQILDTLPELEEKDSTFETTVASAVA